MVGRVGARGGEGGREGVGAGRRGVGRAWARGGEGGREGVGAGRRGVGRARARGGEGMGAGKGGMVWEGVGAERRGQGGQEGVGAGRGGLGIGTFSEASGPKPSGNRLSPAMESISRETPVSAARAAGVSRSTADSAAISY